MVMNHTQKIRGEVRSVNTPIVREQSSRTSTEGRTSTGSLIPGADLHARRIAREAGRWLAFARERSRMSDATLVAKALDATAFSAGHGTHSLALPSKLGGTSRHQRALWGIVRERRSPWCPLDLHDEGGLLIVSMPGSDVLGEVQRKHAPWLRPLVPFGARVYLARVTGHEREGYRLGLNVAFGHVGAALDRLLHALGEGGSSGDGAAAYPAGGDSAPTPSVPVLGRGSDADGTDGPSAA